MISSVGSRNLWRWLLLVILLVCLQYYKYYANKNRKSTDLLHTFANVNRNINTGIMSYQRFLALNYTFNKLKLGMSRKIKYSKNTPVCRINLESLGPRTVNKTRLISLDWVEKQLTQLFPGGYHAPKLCRSRHKVAIFIPYRDRYFNLEIFLYHMHPFWQKQLLEYQVFVIEQYGQYKFNKGALFNIAFMESQRFGTWGCLFFHDVDLIPLDERVLYTCPRMPTHMSPAVESDHFELKYQKLFGGVTAMTPRHFLKVNGYSNCYWSWGGEDDDMFKRIQAAKLGVRRLNSSIARFATLSHAQQEPNPDRYKKLGKAKKRFRMEGLKSIEYQLISGHKRKSFTHIIADVNPFDYQFCETVL
ncbi:hypothetical protein ACJJTC_002504 [Scirpophaga incertulas]